MISGRRSLYRLAKRYLLPLGIFALAIWHHYHWFDVGFNFFDDGLQAYGADRVARGAVLYRDVFTIYGPGRYYLTALAFKILGTDMLTYRLVMLFLWALTAVVAYYLSLHLMVAPLAFMVGLTSIFFNLPDWGVTLALLSLGLMLLYMARGERRWVAISGVATGISVLFRQEAGVYVGLVCVLLLIIHTIRFTRGTNWKEVFIRLGKGLALYGIGVAITVVPIVVYFWAQSALDEIYYLLLPKANAMIKRNALPFPKLFPLLPQGSSPEARAEVFSRLEFYFPIAIYLSTTILLLYRMQKRSLRLLDLQAFGVLLFGVILFNSALVRSDRPHLIFSILPARILSWHLLYRGMRLWHRLRSVRGDLKKVGQLLGIGLLLLALLWSEWHPLVSSYAQLTGEGTSARMKNAWERLEIPRGGAYLSAEDVEFLTEMVQDIQSRVSPEEKTFVYPSVFPVIYFLSGRDNATKYDYILAGVLTREEQQELIEDLESVRYIIKSGGNGLEDTRPEAVASDTELILDYIIEHYEVERTAPRYLILKRGQDS